MSRSLCAVFWSMIFLTLVALLGLWLDPRIITGAPAFLKPLKFALSSALYAWSFGWTLGFLEGGHRLRLRARLANLTAAVLALEVALIFLQAFRGKSSHFNQSTPLDTAIFATMGVAIAALSVSQVVAAVLLLRQPFTDRALASSLRFGMVLAALGGVVGWMMSARLSHTIGAPDGGPGLFLTNWSTGHGDLRAAHFAGLHALQLLPLFAWASTLLRSLTASQRLQLVTAAGQSYSALFALLVVQALRGEPLFFLDAAARTALLLWATATLVLFGRALFARPLPEFA